ncbi:radial spoke head 14 homolog [Anoplopoma fimbria]|uniref:radial spoke head 14 homolog n=1 Tax=Anoplopoma fimbria TaxID=229290 RepID=UPI0023EBB5A6|nr:radial spoke head 14 homolog [Anoplopoma fimbria]
MTGAAEDWTRPTVAFGRRAVPQLFGELHEPGGRLRALTSLSLLTHDPERVCQTVTGGFLEQLKVLFQDEDPSVRIKTCELLHLLISHSIGRRALLSSSLLPPLSLLLDDSSSSCRRSVHRVLDRLAQLPAGAEALLTLVPKLMLKLREEVEEEEGEVEVEEEEEEEEVLLLSTIGSCSRLDPLPALASEGVSLLGRKLSHRSPNIRREAASALMALSVCEDGKHQVCEEALLPVLVELLQDGDVEVQANAAGVIMYTVIITAGKQRCLDLNVIPVLLHLVSQDKEEEEEERKRRRKALVMYSLRALTALAEAPVGRRLLLEQLPLLVKRSEAAEQDQDIRRAAKTAVRVVTWTP